MDGFDMCAYGHGFQVAVFVFVWISWAIVAVLNWRIRNIKSSFNESREITVACTIVFGVLTFMTALSYSATTYPISVKLRVVATSLNHFAAVMTWWLPMAVPLYKCFTDRDAYEKQWIFKLRHDGLQRAYRVNMPSTEGGTASGGNHTLLYQSQADQHHSTHVAALNKELGSANANGKFYYSANNEVDAEKTITQIQPDVLDSSASSRNGDVGASAPLNSSASSLVQRQQFVPTYKRPWDRLVNAVSNIGGPSSTLGSNPSASASPFTDTPPHAPTINSSKPTTSTPQWSGATQGLHANNKYSIDGRQIL
ncbi:hypothetical protein GGI24_005387 [Coemansia furcata]|nr:hypothetical protein GGI24_005387 [Coemansia furcata]